jgi:hypothetical protein
MKIVAAIPSTSYDRYQATIYEIHRKNSCFDFKGLAHGSPSLDPRYVWDSPFFFNWFGVKQKRNLKQKEAFCELMHQLCLDYHFDKMFLSPDDFLFYQSFPFDDPIFCIKNLYIYI